jgi:hypothetical protein
MFTVDERLAQAVRARRMCRCGRPSRHSLDRRHIVALVRAAGRTRQHEQPSGDELDADLQPVGAIRQSTPRKWAAR